ncbi:Spc98 family-domain-containing protein [Dunaliella salina]|uniref:Spc98 family-domain-containing protein n=1 Tax=Dunaliella salina TaxID=3046 RepID=A0ABQ7GG31_DUNSA|nr:Spc98 family-domain-containing protein [Dunaliella salina]|eukprot:KAF5833568.1 Spc98 family-domain-containing protein [Dunaliella salina]
MSSAEQRISDTALLLEQQLCRGLGAVPLAQAIRNIKLKALRDGLGGKLPDAEFNQAVSFLEGKSADKKDFHTKLGRAQARNVKGHRELLALLHVIGSDSSLSVLTKGPMAVPPDTNASQGRPPSQPTAPPSTVFGRPPPPAAANSVPPLPMPASASASSMPSSARSAATPRAAGAAGGALTPPSSAAVQAAMQTQQQAQQQQAHQYQHHHHQQQQQAHHYHHHLHQQQQQQQLQQQQQQQQQQRSSRNSNGSSASGMPGLSGASSISSGRAVAAPASVQQPLGKPHPATAHATLQSSPYASAISPVMRPPPAPTQTKSRPAFPVPDKEDLMPRIPFAGDLFKLDGPGAPSQLEAALAASEQQEAELQRGLGASASPSTTSSRAAASSSLASLLESIPAWHTLRPHLTGRDLVEAAAAPKPSVDVPLDARRQSLPGVHKGANQQQQPLSMFPIDVQEVAITNDLLYAFMGLEARYVQARLVQPPGGLAAPGSGSGSHANSSPTLVFALADGLGLEPCLAELAHRVLPICDYVAVLQRFIETRSALTFGRVSHAVAAALWRLLQDWMLMVTQLEHQLRLGTLRLQALVYYCQAKRARLRCRLSVLVTLQAKHAHVCWITSTVAGLLNLLHAKAASLAGDRAKRALVHRLLHAAAAPYFKMLERWLHDGVLEDAYGEFMVQANKIVGKDALTGNHQLAYWHERYTLRHSPSTGAAAAAADGPLAHLDVPVFLQGCANLILTTGKYLNAIHECRSHMAAEARPSPSAASWGFGTQPAQAVRAKMSSKSGKGGDAGAATAAVSEAIMDAGASVAGTNTAIPSIGGAATQQKPRLAYNPQSSFVQDIMAAHARASASLLHLLRSEQGVGLLTWLRSLKHFFMLDQGDLVVHLAEAAREELDKPVRDISRPRLQSLLELAIRTSSVAQDPHADELSVELDPRSVLELSRDAGALTLGSAVTAGNTPIGTPQRLSTANVHSKVATPSSLLRRPRAEDELGWSALLLSYRLSWPVTLIIPPRALVQYQVIFKHLFNLKHVERQLAAAWHRMQAARNASRASRNALKPAYCLAQRHLFLIQEILRYSTTDVLAPQWAAMEAGVRRAADADQVIHCHATFLARALDGLMLCRLPLLRPLLALQQGALDFAARVNAAWDALEARQEKAASAQAASATAQAELARQSGRTSGPSRVLTPAQSITAAREQQYEGLLGGPASMLQQQQQEGGAQQQQYLDITGLEADYASRLNELVAGLQEMYSTAIQREAGDSHAGSSQATLESREQLEALQGLIERIAVNPAQQPQHAGPQMKSTQAMLAELQSAAARA